MRIALLSGIIRTLHGFEQLNIIDVEPAPTAGLGIMRITHTNGHLGDGCDIDTFGSQIIQGDTPLAPRITCPPGYFLTSTIID